MKLLWKPVSPPVTISATIRASDFKLLKQVLRPVIDRIDHQMLNDLEPFTVLNPSAENIAKYFYDETREQLAAMTGGRVRVKDCTIWETDTTTATYYE
jgi:6-pyruvoyltetrahydropterin/6-carboxytetrahydropterin synthase